MTRRGKRWVGIILLLVGVVGVANINQSLKPGDVANNIGVLVVPIGVMIVAAVLIYKNR